MPHKYAHQVIDDVLDLLSKGKYFEAGSQFDFLNDDTPIELQNVVNFCQHIIEAAQDPGYDRPEFKDLVWEIYNADYHGVDRLFSNVKKQVQLHTGKPTQKAMEILWNDIQDIDTDFFGVEATDEECDYFAEDLEDTVEGKLSTEKKDEKQTLIDWLDRALDDSQETALVFKTLLDAYALDPISFRQEVLLDKDKLGTYKNLTKVDPSIDNEVVRYSLKLKYGNPASSPARQNIEALMATTEYDFSADIWQPLIEDIEANRPEFYTREQAQQMISDALEGFITKDEADQLVNNVIDAHKKRTMLILTGGKNPVNKSVSRIKNYFERNLVDEVVILYDTSWHSGNPQYLFTRIDKGNVKDLSRDSITTGLALAGDLDQLMLILTPDCIQIHSNNCSLKESVAITTSKIPTSYFLEYAAGNRRGYKEGEVAGISAASTIIIGKPELEKHLKDNYSRLITEKTVR